MDTDLLRDQVRDEQDDDEAGCEDVEVKELAGIAARVSRERECPSLGRNFLADFRFSFAYVQIRC